MELVTETDRPTASIYQFETTDRRGRWPPKRPLLMVLPTSSFSPFERNAKDGECHGFFAKT